MKKVFIYIVILAALVCSITCSAIEFGKKKITPSDNMITRELNIADFDEIIASRVNIEYTVGAPGRATLTAPDNVIDEIVVECHDGELKAYVKNRNEYKGNLNATLTVSSDCIKEIDATLSARININSPLDIKSLETNVTTSATINIGTLNCKDCDLSTSTSGSIKIAQLTCSDKAELEASTSGLVDIAVIKTDKLEADASTSGKVSVKNGKINKVDLTATTSGNISLSAAYTRGEAVANTSGHIRLASDNLTSRTSNTGGSIKVR